MLKSHFESLLRSHQDFITPLIRVLYRLANESPYLTTDRKKQIDREIIIYDPNNPFWHKLISDLDMDKTTEMTQYHLF
jgi:hypothetical protein